MIGVKILKDEKTVVLHDGTEGKLVNLKKGMCIVDIDGKHRCFKVVQDKPVTADLAENFWCQEVELKTEPTPEPEPAEGAKTEPEPGTLPPPVAAPKKKKAKKKSKKAEGDE